MKILIIYYSLDGNTDYAARKIADATGADILRLYTKKAFPNTGAKKYIWGGMSAVIAQRPKLKPYELDLNAYDMIVFGFPVWASSITPPLRSFIMENRKILKTKEIAAFACQGGQGAEKAFEKMKKCIGIDSFAREAIFIDPKTKQNEDTNIKIEEFAGLIIQEGSGGKHEV